MINSEIHGYTLQFAIKLPNGALYLKPTQRAMFASMFGPVGDPPRELAVFDERSDAEEVIDEMRKLANEVGVDNLGATIVTRLCSPFLADHDDVAGFVAHIAEWVEKGGDA
jgi:hypothetical protein